MIDTTNTFDASLYGIKQAPSANLDALKKEQNVNKIEETAENFESFFISKMMESMFEGVKTDGMFGGGNSEKIFRSMLLDEYGKSMAQTGSVGVKDYVMNSIIEMQEMESQGFIQKKDLWNGKYSNKWRKR